jgi:hypothetical protein
VEPDPRTTTMAPVSLDPAERFGFVRLRSPLARAVVPVVAGAAAIAVILLATWGIAALMAGGSAELTDRLAPSTFRVGEVEDVADEIDEDGPLVLAGLDTSGERTLVLDHVGDDPTREWHAYWAYPADRNSSCAVVQSEGTGRFTDCEGRHLAVSDLARPRGVCVVVQDQRVLYLDLRGATTPTTTCRGSVRPEG